MRLGLVICSAGRPEALGALLMRLRSQSAPADLLVLSVTGPADLPEGLVPPDAIICTGPPGLAAQRNRALDALRGQVEIVAFFDDDYLPAHDALDGIRRGFRAFPEASGLTGRLLADGIGSGGLDRAKAEALLDRDASPRNRPRALARRLVGLYGCNMAFRMDAVGTTRFDEALPLYGWQEDVDFAARVPGEKLATDAFSGVHLGLRSGRETRGLALGYSQLANPAYLWRKGSLPLGFALRLMLRSVLANHLRALRPEPWIDRVARARGNRRALVDLLRGTAAPGRILDLR
ncbi:glycosyltransferase family 2 protein [Litorisediminicola beolgyonensis]|uniref:Glycosyltransferase family 2 protein n=1 Tax=Litorisediminicola beolgyonensis TaxID=1173614 RepID=A0ABW3ZIS9_9RHOB